MTRTKPQRLSYRAAVDAMCKVCIYDPISRGTWREQVAECSSSSCPLHPLRPLPIGAKRHEDLGQKAQSSPADDADAHDSEERSDDAAAAI